MEGAQVEARPQGLFGLPAQAGDRQLAQLVGQGLRRPGDVAVDLGLDLMTPIG